MVKAVLLLRRNAEEEPLKLPKVKPQPEQQSRIKPSSAPSRYRSLNTAKNDEGSRNASPFPAESHISVKCDNRNLENKKDIQSSPSDFAIGCQSKKENKIAAANVRRPKSVNDMYSSNEGSKRRPKSRGAAKGSSSLIDQKLPQSQRVTLSDNKGKKKSISKKGKSPNITKFKKSYQTQQTNATATQKSKDEDIIHNEGKPKTSVSGMEKYVSTSGNFIVKEIINTGNPKRLSSPQGYQRFGLSMFAILDNENEVENNRNLGPNPWGVSYAASKWMTGIRKKRLHKVNESDQSTSPVPTPLIVIEEYAPENRQQSDDEGNSSASDCSSEEFEFHSDKDAVHTKKMTRWSRGTPSPSLEQLKEEEEEDIKEYDKHEAGKAVKER